MLTPCMLGRVIAGLFSYRYGQQLSRTRRKTSCSRLLSTMGALATQTVSTTKRLEALRLLMQKPENNVNAYVVPSEDQREYHNLKIYNVCLILHWGGRFERVQCCMRRAAGVHLWLQWIGRCVCICVNLSLLTLLDIRRMRCDYH